MNTSQIVRFPDPPKEKKSKHKYEICCSEI